MMEANAIQASTKNQLKPYIKSEINCTKTNHSKTNNIMRDKKPILRTTVCDAAFKWMAISIANAGMTGNK